MLGFVAPEDVSKELIGLVIRGIAAAAPAAPAAPSAAPSRSQSSQDSPPTVAMRLGDTPALGAISAVCSAVALGAAATLRTKPRRAIAVGIGAAALAAAALAATWQARRSSRRDSAATSRRGSRGPRHPLLSLPVRPPADSAISANNIADEAEADAAAVEAETDRVWLALKKFSLLTVSESHPLTQTEPFRHCFEFTSS